MPFGYSFRITSYGLQSGPAFLAAVEEPTPTDESAQSRTANDYNRYPTLTVEGLTLVGLMQLVTHTSSLILNRSESTLDGKPRATHGLESVASRGHKTS